MVALTYKEESKEEVLWAEDDIKKNWVKKLSTTSRSPLVRLARTSRIGLHDALQLIAR